MNQKTLMYLAFFSVCILALTFFIPVIDTNAFFGGSIGGSKIFGGQVMYSTYCTCSGYWAIKLGGPAGGDFIYQMGGTTLYANYKPISIGTWDLGLASPVSLQCMQYRGTTCSADEVIPSGNLMTMVGTS